MQDMTPWTEYISALPEDKFFYLMRLYLGEIKTPFNKQRLIEQLASFMRNSKNLENLISLLDETDLKILTIINTMPAVASENFCSFLEDEMTESSVLVRLENLQSRLIIYTVKNPYTRKNMYKISPLVIDELQPYLNPACILPEPEADHIFLESGFTLTPNFLAAFISYLNITGCSLKADGTFKKTDLTNLNQIFGDKINCLQFLISAFLNLGLVHEGEKKLTVDEKRLADFSSMSELEQIIILCISSVMRLSSGSLKKQSQLLADTMASIPEYGCTRKTFMRMAQMVAGRPSSSGASVKSVSRFSEMLNQARQNGNENGGISDAYSLMDAAFDSMIELGLLVPYGKSEKDGIIYKPGLCNDNVSTNFSFSSENQLKVLNINASSSVTLLPGLSLKALLPLMNFMQAVHCSTVTEFEISRKSVSCAFDRGMNLEKVKELLSNYATFELPQNLLFNLEEWFNAYSSAVLYKGFVLKVSNDNIALVEKNPQVSKYVQEKLADGVYLLNLPVNSDASDFLKTSGLDFMGSVKSVKADLDFISFPRLTKGCAMDFIDPTKEYKILPPGKGDEFTKKLLRILNGEEGSVMDEHQKESFHSRIFNHLIISEEQIRPSSVRSEVLVAEGMDFPGKVHLIDASIKSNDDLELTLVKTDGSGELFTVKVHPVKIIKTEGEAILKCEYLPGKEQGSFTVSRILHIKRIRNEIK